MNPADEHAHLPALTDAHFRILVESVRDYAIYFLDPQGIVRSWNVGAERLKGYSAQEIIGQHFSRFFRPEDAAAGVPERELASALREGRSEQAGWRVRKDGSQFWANVIITPLRDASGRHIGFAKVTRDLTDSVYRAFVEATNSIFWTTDAGGRANADSPSWRAFTGQTQEEWFGRRAWEPVHPEDVARVQADWAAAKAQRRPFESELRLRRKDGEYVWMAIRAIPFTHPDGTVREWFGVNTDISARKRAEEERARALSLWSTTLASIGDAVISTDVEGRVTFMNAVAEALTGWAMRDAVGQPLAQVFSIVNESSRRQVSNPVDRVLREGVVVGLANHTVLVRRDGTDVAIDDSAAPIRDAAGSLYGAVLVFRDVTREKLEEARSAFLTRAGEELLAAADYRDSLATVANLAVPRLADWCSVEILEGEETTVRHLAIAHVDPAKVAYARELRRRFPPSPAEPRGLYAVLRSGRPEIYPDVSPEMVEQSTGGEEQRAMLRKLQIRSAMLVPLRGRDRVFGAITFVFAESGRHYTEDDLFLAEELARRASLVIERRRLEEERAQLLEREREARLNAEIANRAKDEFLAVVSHELRNPLSVIMGRTQLLLLKSLPEDIKKHLGTIERNTRAQARLIEDVLDVSRIISGKLRLELQRTDVADAAADAVGAARSLAEVKRIELSVDVEPGLELLTDPVRLQQIIGNLVSNAVKFTPEGGKVWVEGRRAGAAVRLVVRDNGEGIDPSHLSTIFEPFRQADASTTRRHGGLGLGLTIVRQLVQAHGGTVRAESAGKGHGATFVVELPVRAGTPDRPPERPAAPAGALPRLHGIRVLAVDDQPDALELVRDVLVSAGAEVETATSADEAAEKARRFAADVLVTDVAMPGEDGYALLRRLRRDAAAAHARIPAVALTAYARPEDAEQARAAGFEAHLPKPVDAGNLVGTVARLHRGPVATAPR
ncbi:MAG TPA: PAS domain S-box protein [Myxococcales bacterium]|nr:PAS domain S-box protein [Myxococcales bacterium]